MSWHAAEEGEGCGHRIVDAGSARERDVRDLLAVEPQHHGLAHPLVGEGRAPVGQGLDVDAVVVGGLLDLRPHVGHAGQQDRRVRIVEIGDMHAPVAQRRNAGRVVRDEEDLDLIHDGMPLAPVVRIALKRPGLVLQVLGHHERSRSQHLFRDVEGPGFQLLERDDRGVDRRERGQQRAVGALQLDAHGMRVVRDDLCNGSGLARPERASLGGPQPVEALHHVIGGDGTSVRELGVLPQVKDIGGGRGLLPRFGEQRLEGEIPRGLDQRLVHEEQHLPRHAVGRHVHVERVDVVGLCPRPACRPSCLQPTQRPQRKRETGGKRRAPYTPAPSFHGVILRRVSGDKSSPHVSPRSRAAMHARLRAPRGVR